MREPPRAHVVRRLEELRALRSPIRQYLLQVLELEGPLSVREMAERLQRTPESLYYHVEKLVDVGLLRIHGKRPSGRRPEVLYGLRARTIFIDQSRRSKAFLGALGEIYRANLKKLERDLAWTLELDCDSDPKQPRRSGVLTFATRLRPENLERFGKLLLQVGAFLGQHDDPDGEPLRVTLAFGMDAGTPVED